MVYPESQKGGLSLKGIFFLLLVVSMIYAGVKLVPHWFTYYEMKYAFESEAERAHLRSDEEITKHLVSLANELNLPIEAKDINIERKDGEIEVSTSYDIEVNFLGRYKRTFNFSIDTVKPIKARQ